MANVDVAVTLREAVDDVLGQLTGLDLTFDQGMDRFHIITRMLNRAMRDVALEHEWSYYADTEEVSAVQSGTRDIEINSRLRARIMGDDAVRLVNAAGKPIKWAYFLPRDALHKYGSRNGLWCSIIRTTITFSRPFWPSEQGLRIMLPVMREPRMFDIPPSGQAVDAGTLAQLVDFDYPDMVVARAMYLYAQTDPVMQPRAQTLEESYKDMLYALKERDERHTDSPYVNEFLVPIQNSVAGPISSGEYHNHPHSDWGL